MTKDELTPDENRALKEQLAELVDKFTTDAPESETEPTAVDTKDDEEPAAEEAKEEQKDVVHNNILVIKDRAVKQESAVKKTDWLYSKAGKKAFADTLKQAGGRLNGTFDAMWRAKVAEHTNDAITGLALPVDVESMFISALGNSDGIISHFQSVNAKGLSLNLIDAASDEA